MQPVRRARPRAVRRARSSGIIGEGLSNYACLCAVKPRPGAACDSFSDDDAIPSWCYSTGLIQGGTDFESLRTTSRSASVLLAHRALERDALRRLLLRSRRALGGRAESRLDRVLVCPDRPTSEGRARGRTRGRRSRRAETDRGPGRLRRADGPANASNAEVAQRRLLPAEGLLSKGRSFDAGAEHEPVVTDRLIAIADHPPSYDARISGQVP